MNHDDDMVLDYLGKFPHVFVSVMEVCKRAADRRRFNSQPDWARAVLSRLAQQGVLEANPTGQYRIKIKEEKEEEKKHRNGPRPDPSQVAEPEAVASAGSTPAAAPAAMAVPAVKAETPPASPKT